MVLNREYAPACQNGRRKLRTIVLTPMLQRHMVDFMRRGPIIWGREHVGGVQTLPTQQTDTVSPSTAGEIEEIGYHILRTPDEPPAAVAVKYQGVPTQQAPTEETRPFLPGVTARIERTFEEGASVAFARFTALCMRSAGVVGAFGCTYLLFKGYLDYSFSQGEAFAATVLESSNQAIVEAKLADRFGNLVGTGIGVASALGVWGLGRAIKESIEKPDNPDSLLERYFPKSPDEEVGVVTYHWPFN